MRVAIVNDSVMAQELIRRTIAAQADLAVAWTAANGVDAVKRCCQDRPDLVLMDLVMPEMDGVAATAEIMRRCACPILIVTLSIDRNRARAFEAMGAGAIDVMPTPANWQKGNDLLQKIRQIERLRRAPDIPCRLRMVLSGERPEIPLVLIGASAGGPAALAKVLGSLPPSFEAGTIVAQHLDPRFSLDFVCWLQKQTPLEVRAARAGDSPALGTVLVSAENRHLIFQSGGRLSYTEKPQAYHVPSIDALFFSAAELPEANVAAVVLTGMGQDGAAGMKALKEGGHLTIAQDEATSALYGMPRAAARLGAAREILPLGQIAARLTTFVQAKTGGNPQRPHHKREANGF